MIGDELLTLPLAIWARLRAEGLTFSLALDAKDPDLWRFGFAPQAELRVSINGNWAWHGVAGRARRLVVPLVEEAEAWLDGARPIYPTPPPPAASLPSGRLDAWQSPAQRSSQTRSARRR